MAKEVTEERNDIKMLEAKLDKYVKQRDTVEATIDQYVELYQKLNGAIDATTDILNELKNDKESK